MECIIEAYNLGKSSPIEGAPPILDDCSIFIGPGMTTIVGPSGAGKTSLLYALSGLDAPSTGKVFTLGGMSTRSRTNAARAPRSSVPQVAPSEYTYAAADQNQADGDIDASTPNPDSDSKPNPDWGGGLIGEQLSGYSLR